MRIARCFVLTVVVSMLAASSAQADTVRAHFVFSPASLQAEHETLAATVMVVDEEGRSLSSAEPNWSIPRASLTGGSGDFSFVDHDQPSTRGFCLFAGYGHWESTPGMLRPQLRSFGATASALSGSVQVTFTDPDGSSRTGSFAISSTYDAPVMVKVGTTPDGIPTDPESDYCGKLVSSVCAAGPAGTGAGGAPPILGTPGADRLNGSPGNDCVYGEEGDDRLDGKGGEDTVDGGGGNDYVVGGAGRDVLKGGEGRDLLSDGLGANSYDAGPGDDVVAARQSIGEQIDCGPGRDLAVVDRKDHVSNCEQVERPPGNSRSQPASGGGRRAGRALASTIHWPPISAGWWHLSSDVSENWAFRKTSGNPQGLSCFAESESMIAGIAGAWTGGTGNQRRIEIQFRWIDISPAEFDRLNWIQRMGQAVGSPEHKSPWTSMSQFYSNYNWRQRLPAGQSRWMQYRVKWVVNADHDKVSSTDWLTMGVCNGA